MSNLISESKLNADYVASAHWVNKLSKLGIDVVIRERSYSIPTEDGSPNNSNVYSEHVNNQTTELIWFAEDAIQYDYTSYELALKHPDWCYWMQRNESTIMQIMKYYVDGIAPRFLFDRAFCIHLSRISFRDRLGDIIPVNIIYWDPYETPSPDEKPGKVGERRGWVLFQCPPTVHLGRELITFFQVNWYSDVWYDNPPRKERNDQDNGSQSGSNLSDCESESGFTSFFG